MVSHRRKLDFWLRLIASSPLFFPSSTCYLSPPLTKGVTNAYWHGREDRVRGWIGQRNHAGRTTPELLPCWPQGPSFSDKLEGTSICLKRAASWPTMLSVVAHAQNVLSLPSPLSARWLPLSFRPQGLQEACPDWLPLWQSPPKPSRKLCLSPGSQGFPTHVILLLTSQCPCLSLAPAVSSFMSVPWDTQQVLHSRLLRVWLFKCGFSGRKIRFCNIRGLSLNSFV